MSQNTQTEAPAGAGEPAQAGGARAAEGGPGLDLSLGHFGTPHLERRWDALCDYCHRSMPDEAYQAAERLAGPREDPRCPNCNKSFWSFHPRD